MHRHQPDRPVTFWGIFKGPRDTAHQSVIVAHGDGHLGDQPDLILQEPRHGSGVSWGYSGSGPAELARQLLWHVIGEEPHPAAYQNFKAQVIAPLPQDQPWRMTSDFIAGWAAGWEACGSHGPVPRFLTVAAYEAHVAALPVEA